MEAGSGLRGGRNPCKKIAPAAARGLGESGDISGILNRNFPSLIYLPVTAFAKLTLGIAGERSRSILFLFEFGSHRLWISICNPIDLEGLPI